MTDKKGTSLWGSAKEPEEKDKDKKEPMKELNKQEIERLYKSMKKVHNDIVTEMKKVISGQEDVIEKILITLFTRNHALLEGFPGLGKTMMIRTLSQIVDLEFKRIQCTPDVMPSDITGTYVIEEDDSGKKAFRFEQGPVFTNILLADEINRGTPKAQSALLESMQEKQVTVGNKTYKLEEPFCVLATQNPIEMEGTYPLPEAQLDRFLFKILVGYPTKEDEKIVMNRYAGEEYPEIKRILTRNQIVAIQKLVRKVPVSSDISDYALKIITATRPDNNGVAKEYLDYGASPRASIGVILASKARALLEGRNYVSKEDVEAMVFPVLRHRIILNFKSERMGIKPDEVIEKIVKEA